MYIKKLFEEIYDKLYKAECINLCKRFDSEIVKYAITNNFGGVKVRTGYNYLFSSELTPIIKKVGVVSELSWLCGINLDDIYDNDQYRYSKPATHTVFNCEKIIEESELLHQNLLKEFEEHHIKINFSLQWKIGKNSFRLEKENSNNEKLSLDQFIEIYLSKIACGIFSAYETQYISAPEFSRDAEKYAIFIGIAGQIKNDILDFSLEGYEEYAKFSDLKNGYITYPLLLLREIDRDKFKKILESKNESYCKKIFEEYDLLLQALSDAAFLSEQAKDYVYYIEDSKKRDMLIRWSEEQRKFNRLDKHIEYYHSSKLSEKILKKINKIKIFH
jgi:geranylgeranyl pyrophosphate synthase